MTVIIRGAGVEGAASNAGLVSHAEGAGCSASGDKSHAEGDRCTSSGVASHAEGTQASATGAAAHAEGASTFASGTNAHAEGAATTASGNYSHAQGRSVTAGKYGQHAQSGVLPSTLSSSTVAQYSVYTTAGVVGPGNGSTVELCFTADNFAVNSGAGTNVLIIPLKSVLLVSYEIVARPTGTADLNPVGCAWSGSLLCGKGNAAGTSAVFSGSTNGASTGNLTLPQTLGFAEGSQGGIFIQASIDSSNTSLNYLKLVLTNSTSGKAWAALGVLRCVELVTNV